MVEKERVVSDAAATTVLCTPTSSAYKTRSNIMRKFLGMGRWVWRAEAKGTNSDFHKSKLMILGFAPYVEDFD